MTKEFKDLDELIALLKSRNLEFENEDRAKIKILNYGYYEIVNGYKDFLLIENKNSASEIYREGSTFENLYSLYKFDKNLAKTVRDATLEFENILRSVLSYVISKKIGYKQKEYLKKEKYNHGHIDEDGCSQLDYLFLQFDKILNSNLQPYIHYRKDHGNIPPWILLKGASLGNLVYFYKLQKSDIKKDIIRILLGIPNVISIENYHYRIIDTIVQLSHKFRNTSSHSGRIYNYHASYYQTPYLKFLHDSMGITKSQFDDNKKGQNDLYTLLSFYSLLDEYTPYINLSVGMQLDLTHHIESYPEDRDLILLEMGVPKKKLNDSLDSIFTIQVNK